jgi:hypothetical protein
MEALFLMRKILLGATLATALVLAPLTATTPATAATATTAKTVATTDLTSNTAAGLGSYTFNGKGALAGQSVKIWYNVPSKGLGALSDAKIHFVMHGTTRTAESYRNTWVPLLATKNVLLITPEFSTTQFPGSRTYNQGSVLDSRGALRPQEAWSFSMIEAVFDDVVKRVNSTQKDYTMFGHSAGGQFVERFVQFMPQARVRQAVAANPGWHTMPDAGQAYPYGLTKVPTAPADMKVALGRDFTLLLGADDTDPNAADLQRDPKTDRQGITRLSRGQNFYAAAQKYAGLGSAFNWKLRVVPGVGHSHSGAAKAAAPLLFP